MQHSLQDLYESLITSYEAPITVNKRDQVRNEGRQKAFTNFINALLPLARGNTDADINALRAKLSDKAIYEACERYKKHLDSGQ